MADCNRLTLEGRIVALLDRRAESVEVSTRAAPVTAGAVCLEVLDSPQTRHRSGRLNSDNGGFLRVAERRNLVAKTRRLRAIISLIL
jgi:hypothetical protein